MRCRSERPTETTKAIFIFNVRCITWPKAGVIEDDVRIASERGPPQGAVVSPLRVNIYLHYVFDR